MIRACEKANEQCPIYHRAPPEQLASTQEHGCFSDTDHKVSASVLNNPNIPSEGFGRVILVNYIRSEVNLQQMCRADHEAKNQLEAETGEQYYSLPSLETMVYALRQYHKESGRNASSSLRKAMRAYDQSIESRELIVRDETYAREEHSA